MGTLLVVDFDWFFPNPLEAGDTDWSSGAGLYDWGHAESPFFLSNVLWSTRASAFFEHDLPLPRVLPPEGGWAAFWNRFTFTKNTTMRYADSNMHAGELRDTDGGPFDSVLLFALHHDSGYQITSIRDVIERGTYSCEDWMVIQHLAGCENLTVHYPTWKPAGPTERIPADMPTVQMVDDGEPINVVIDHVFICRSGAWVPPWCDRDFAAFLAACPLTGVQVDDEPMDRGFEESAARQMAAATRQMLAVVRAAQENRTD